MRKGLPLLLLTALSATAFAVPSNADRQHPSLGVGHTALTNASATAAEAASRFKPESASESDASRAALLDLRRMGNKLSKYGILPEDPVFGANHRLLIQDAPNPRFSGQATQIHAPRANQSVVYNGFNVYYEPKTLYKWELGAATQISANSEIIDYGYIANGGGTLVDGRYYQFVDYYYYSSYGVYGMTFVSLDLETDEAVVGDAQVNAYDMIARDVAYDAQSGLVYGAFYNENGSTPLVWGTRSTEDGTVTPITTTETMISNVAIDGQGQTWGLDDNYNLLKITKETGAVEVVGPTGIIPQYLGSFAADPATGLLYYSFSDPADSKLYEIDPSTAQASVVWDIIEPVQIYGAYIEGEALPVSALYPGDIQNFAVTPEGGASHTVTINFNTPLYAADGETLLNMVEVVTTVQGAGLDSTDVATIPAGNAVTRTYTVPADGQYTFTVYARNEEGNGRKASITTGWLGLDAPAAPTNVVASVDGSDVTLTWNAPATGLHNGYFEADKVVYSVVRTINGEATEVATGLQATTFAESLDITDYSTISYTVTSSAGSLAGQSATSNVFNMGSYSAPVVFPLTTAASFNEFTVVDLNGGNTWTFYSATGAAAYTYHSYIPGDDWLISPDILVEAGEVYRLSFNTYAQGVSYPERIEVKYGVNVESVEDLTETAVAPTNVTWTTPTQLQSLVRATATGKLRIGVHAISDADQWRLYVTNLALSAPINPGTPLSPSDVVVEPGFEGAHNVTLIFSAPTKNFGGEDLEADGLRVKVLNAAGEVVYVGEAAPGERVKVANIPAVNGVNSYSITAFNDFGESDPVQASGFAGFDVPLAPANLDYVPTANGFHITWDAVTEGATGQYIGTPGYYLARYYNGVVDTVAYNITATEFDDTFEVLESPAFLQYVVQAATPVSRSADTFAPFAYVLGHEELPYVENFVGSLNSWWGTFPIAGRGSWNLASASSDGDGSALAFINQYPYYYGTAENRFLTAPVRTEGLHDLKLAFDASVGSYRDNLFVEVSTDNGYTWTILDVIGTTSGFESFAYNLNEYIGQEIMVGLRAINASGTNVLIDNLRFRQPYDFDLALKSLSVPSTVNAPGQLQAVATIKNEGELRLSNQVKVTFYDGEEVLGEVPVDVLLNPGDEITVPFAIDLNLADAPEGYAFKAVAEFPADEDLSNNESSVVNVNVHKLNLPTATDLAAQLGADGQTALLTWTAPAAGEAPVPVSVFDDFESYDNFIIENIGNWTLVDGDGVGVYGWENGPEYDHLYEPHAWQVFNPTAAGFSDWNAHSGNKILISICPNTQADDWLISPELSGNAQTISFYISEITNQYGNELYEVLYSTTGKDVADFHIIGGTRTVTAIGSEYEQVTVDLPAGAKYFAIRHTSNDVFAMYIDDITYEATTTGSVEGELIGYNVYRNGVKLNDEVLTEPQYEVELTKQPADFTVTAVYDKGESLQSEALTLQVEIPAELLPAPTALKGELLEGGETANLTWEAPEVPVGVRKAATVTESFETLEAFTISDFGDWTVIDGDGSPLSYGVTNSQNQAYAFPHNSEGFGFIALSTEGLASYGMQAAGWPAADGDIFLAAFAACDNDYNAVKNDDWLISPALSGNAQTITFSAAGTQYKDPFEVLYSTTDKDPSSFTLIGSATPQAPSSALYEWKEYSYNVPAGAKYFAIHYVGLDGWILGIDNVTYEPASGEVPNPEPIYELLGYNVFRDGELLNSELVTETSYKVTLTEAEAEYTVSAVYVEGESLPSAGLVLAADAPNVADYYVQAADAIADGTQITSVDNIVLTYGRANGAADGGWKVNSDARKFTDAEGTTYSFFAHATGTANPHLASGVADGGVFVEFTPAEGGTIDVAIVANADKAFHLLTTNGEKLSATYYDNGEAKTIADGDKFAAKYYGFVTFEVEANKTYQLFVQGSKMGYYGFNFTGNGNSLNTISVDALGNGAVYDLAGRKVQEIRNGQIFIQNGKSQIRK